jgi:glycosyltransferase involved in cell wall biosynthesis
MRVGISAYLMHAGNNYRAAGVSVYTLQLLRHLPAAAPSHCYVAFVGTDAPRVAGVASVTSPIPTRNPLIRIGWEQTGLPVQAKLAGVKMIHGTVNVAPWIGRIPTVITVHDLAFLRFPERFPARKAMYLEAAVRRSVRLAHRIIAVSEHTRRDLIDLLGAHEERISVVYSGVDSRFHLMLPDESASVSQKWFGGRPYLLHVGTLEPRKNIDVLIRAFGQSRQKLHLPHVLALVGAPGWMYESLFRLRDELGLSDSVHFAGYVAPGELPLWYTGADLFVYPSAYEGFGLPLAEAMACGVPAIASASSSLPELADGACLMVEPGSQEALQVAMTRVLGDERLRGEMKQRGLERARGLSWEETARQTARVYELAAATS